MTAAREDRLDPARLAALSRELLGRPFADLSPVEQAILLRILSRHSYDAAPTDQSPPDIAVGMRVADAVARVGGSWGFVIAFCCLLLLWVALNGVVLIRAGVPPFDPYPFIFLNLVLSMLAALQAPIIMMSQNRAAARDRAAAGDAFATNVRSEIEIRRLHERLDLLEAHWRRRDTPR